MTTFNTIALTETVVESFWLNRLSQKDVPFYFKRPSESYLIWSQSESSETDRCNQFTVQRSLPLNPPSRFTLDLIDLETNFYSLNIDFILLHWKYFHVCLNTATYQSIVIEFSCTAAFHHIELPCFYLTDFLDLHKYGYDAVSKLTHVRDICFGKLLVSL